MPIANDQSPPAPSLGHALLCFTGVVAIIASGLFLFGIELHSLMFFCLLWSGINAHLLGYSYSLISDQMAAAIMRALPAITIFILIGMVIASFMHSGTIATLMYYPAVDRWGFAGGRVYATAINVLTLEVYYRYENVFGAGKRKG